MFFKIINLKIRKPTVFLSTKLNKPTYNFSFFVFNQTLLKCLYEKNNNKTSPRINFFLNFLKKNRKYFFTDVYVFYNFLRIKDQS